MKIKALTSFAGKVSMFAGEVREVEDQTAASLIACGYAEKQGEEKKIEEKKAKGVKSDEDK